MTTVTFKVVPLGLGNTLNHRHLCEKKNLDTLIPNTQQ